MRITLSQAIFGFFAPGRNATLKTRGDSELEQPK